MLIILVSRSSGERIELEVGNEPITIGRAQSNMIVLEHDLVSRQHALLSLQEDVPTIADLGSKNGTWLNGTRIDEPATVAEGDVLKLGDVEFDVRSPDQQTRTIAPRRSPEETMTVLFTDLEGHTALFEELGTDRAHALVRRLLGIMTDEVSGHDGTLIKSEGDGVIATFAGVRSALQCAVAIQRRSSTLPGERPVRVRIGINTGDAIREADDVMGVSVIKAARIMSHATGGEILIGEASRLLLGPGGDWKIAAKGWFTLKGISRRERLYQVDWQTS